MTENPPEPEIDLKAQASEQAELLVKKHKEGSGWFFWIAGLSLVNSVVILSGSDWSFLIGLGATQVIDAIAMAFAQESGAEGITIISVIAFVLDVIVAGSFVLWGILARKNFRWPYIVGMILYSLDGLIFLLVKDFPSLGFHLFALFYLYNGFKACGQLNRLSALSSALADTTESSVDTENPSPITDPTVPSEGAPSDIQ